MAYEKKKDDSAQRLLREQIKNHDLQRLYVFHGEESYLKDFYKGEIEKISGAATKNSNGVAVVDTIIKVTNPDSDIILGVEATNKIHAEKAQNTIVVPFEYILTDETGDYVYVVDNGVVVRKDVELGITTSTDAQVLSGLNEGDEIITSDASLLTEGMAVTAANIM